MGRGNTPFLLKIWGRGMLCPAGREKTPFCFKLRATYLHLWHGEKTFFASNLKTVPVGHWVPPAPTMGRRQRKAVTATCLAGRKKGLFPCLRRAGTVSVGLWASPMPVIRYRRRRSRDGHVFSGTQKRGISPCPYDNGDGIRRARKKGPFLRHIKHVATTAFPLRRTHRGCRRHPMPYGRRFQAGSK